MEEYLSLIKHCSSMKNLPFQNIIEVRIRSHSSYDCISQLIVVCPHCCMDQLKLNVRDNSFLRVFLTYANSNGAQRSISRTNFTPDLRRRALNEMVRTGDTIEPPADNRDREPSQRHHVDLQKSSRQCLVRTRDGSLRGEGNRG